MKVEFIDGFAVGFRMAVAECFKDSVKRERFNAGDIIYSDKRAYLPLWSDAVKHVDYAFRVVSMDGEDIKYDVLKPTSNRKGIVKKSDATEPITAFLDKLKHGIE